MCISVINKKILCNLHYPIDAEDEVQGISKYCSFLYRVGSFVTDFASQGNFYFIIVLYKFYGIVISLSVGVIVGNGVILLAPEHKTFPHSVSGKKERSITKER